MTDMLSYRPVVTAVPQPVREESPGYGAEENQAKQTEAANGGV